MRETKDETRNVRDRFIRVRNEKNELERKKTGLPPKIKNLQEQLRELREGPYHNLRLDLELGGLREAVEKQYRARYAAECGVFDLKEPKVRAALGGAVDELNGVRRKLWFHKDDDKVSSAERKYNKLLDGVGRLKEAGVASWCCFTW